MFFMRFMVKNVAFHEIITLNVKGPKGAQSGPATDTEQKRPVMKLENLIGA
jgi:hypothetical protein